MNKVQSGLCNRLIPFITAYRLSKLLNCKFYLNWDDKCGDSAYTYKGKETTYNDMFESFPSIHYISLNQINPLLSSKNKILTISNVDYKN